MSASLEPQPTLSSMSAPSLRPPPLGGRIIGTLGVVLGVLAAALGAGDVLAPPHPAHAPRDLHTTLARLAFVRPVSSTERERALDVVEAAMRATGARVNRRRGVAVAHPWGPLVYSDEVVGTVAGAHDGARVVLVAHADSVGNTTASGDDAAGVAVALAVLDDVAHGARLDGDVTAVITGQEEACVACGAALFDARADLVVNLDSGGNAGPFAVYETQPNNAALAALLAKAAPSMFASSLIDGFTRVFTPSEGRTELAAFAGLSSPSSPSSSSGAAGVGIGYLGGRRCYHSACDDLALVDEAALGVAALNATALVRAAASLPRGSLQASHDAVLVRVPLVGLVAVPFGLAMLLVVVTALLALANAVWCGFRRFRDVAIGALALPLAGVAAAFAAVLARAAVSGPFGTAVATAQSPLVVGAGALAGLGAAIFVAGSLARKRTLAFAAGSSFAVALVVVIAAFATPELGGIAAVFALPVVAGAFVAALVGSRTATVPTVPLLFGAALPILCAHGAAILALTATDLDETVVIAFGALLCAVAAAAVAPLCTPAFPVVTRLTLAAGVVAAAFLVVTAGRAGAFDAGHPQPVTLAYAQGPHGAALFTTDDPPSTTVLGRLGPRAAGHALDDVFPGTSAVGAGGTRGPGGGPAFTSTAVSSSKLPPPSLIALSAKARSGGRTWRLALRSQRGARDLRLTVHSNVDARPIAFHLEGQTATPCAKNSPAPCTIQILGNSRAVVDVDIDGNAAPDCTLVDVTPGIPAALSAPWPAGFAASPSGDRAYVAVRITPALP